jgi:hypothetical protein
MFFVYIPYCHICIVYYTYMTVRNVNKEHNDSLSLQEKIAQKNKNPTLLVEF